MDSISILKTKYGIDTHISVDDGSIRFSGVYKWTDTWRKSRGLRSVWSEIMLLMADAERIAQNITVI